MPTGAVDWGMLLWLLGVLGAAIVGAGSAVLWGVSLFAKRDRAISAVEEKLELRALGVETAATAAINEVTRQLADFRAHVGETFATKTSVTVQLERVEEGLQRMGDKVENSVERLTTRIDRLLEARPESQRKATQ